MLSQKTLNAVDGLMSNPMINTVELFFRSYAKLPGIMVHANADVPEEEVVVLISSALSPVKIEFEKIDHEFRNCWGNSYSGKTEEVEISLLTFTTKEKAPAGKQEPQENIHLDNTTVWTPEQILRNEG